MTRSLLPLLMLLACKQETPAPPPAPAPPPPTETSTTSEIPAHQDMMGKAHAHEPSDKKNQIAYKDPRCSGIQPCECSGTIVYGQNAIAKIGVTEDDLAKGTPCLLGDFDANGTQDVAFVEKTFGTGKAAVQVQVLLFDELGLRDTPVFPKRVTTLAIHTKDGKVGLLEPTSRLFFHYQDGKFEMVRI